MTKREKVELSKLVRVYASYIDDEQKAYEAGDISYPEMRDSYNHLKGCMNGLLSFLYETGDQDIYPALDEETKKYFEMDI